MAKDDLTGNMPTEQIVAFFDRKGEETGIDATAFTAALEMAATVFP
jgi:hydroxymethylglutaryl-CoA lyase